MANLKFPFDYQADGSLVTVPSDSDEFYSQILPVCALTEPGTYPFTPGFGVFDPSFRTIDRGSYIIQASRFVPEILVTNVEGEFSEFTGKTSLKVSFRRT